MFEWLKLGKKERNRAVLYTFDVDGNYATIQPVWNEGPEGQPGKFIANQHGFLVPVGRDGCFDTPEDAREALDKVVNHA